LGKYLFGRNGDLQNGHLLEVGKHRVFRARPERPLEQALEAGQAVRVVGQPEVTKI
jgi:hypothetical protein